MVEYYEIVPKKNRWKYRTSLNRILEYLDSRPDKTAKTSELSSYLGLSKHYTRELIETLAYHGKVEKINKSRSWKLA